MSTEPACLLIADISGYTGYLAGVEIDHAQDILADLMGTIVGALRPGFKLAKLEGDAAFTFAVTDRIDGSLLLDTIETCYFGFRRRRRDMRQATTCECNACVRIPDLDLKFVVHHGTVLRQVVMDHEELLGADVILVHRLLKNEVVERTGIRAYAVFSEACAAAMDVDPAALGMLSSSETYDHFGTVPVWIHDLDRRWAEEDARARVIVGPDEAMKSVTIRTSAPAQVAWEFVTAPGRRTQWQVGVTGVDVVATGGRRGVGSVTHCMHGAEASIEEVLDWRPYDYYTISNTIPTPMGPVQMIDTTEFTPELDGTAIQWRFGALATTQERAIFEQMEPWIDQAMAESAALLNAMLTTELERIHAAAMTEATLPPPRPTG